MIDSLHHHRVRECGDPRRTAIQTKRGAFTTTIYLLERTTLRATCRKCARILTKTCDRKPDRKTVQRRYGGRIEWGKRCGVGECERGDDRKVRIKSVCSGQIDRHADQTSGDRINRSNSLAAAYFSMRLIHSGCSDAQHSLPSDTGNQKMGTGKTGRNDTCIPVGSFHRSDHRTIREYLHTGCD